MKKLLTVLLTLLTTFSVLSFAACGEVDKALDDGTLTVGYTIYPPMNYEDETGKLIGFDTELAELFAKELGVEIEFVKIEWESKIAELNSGTIDCIWNGMTITEELQNATAVSAPYRENKQVVLCKKENAAKFTDIASVKNAASVCYEGGSAGESAAESAGVDENKCNKAAGQIDAFMEVGSGKSEIAIVDIGMAEALTAPGTSYEELTYVDVGFELEQFGVSFRKGDAGLRDQFNEFIEKTKKDGTFDALVEKYL